MKKQKWERLPSVQAAYTSAAMNPALMRRLDIEKY
jgi:hypothetical protein